MAQPAPGTTETRFALIIVFPFMAIHAVVTRIWESLGTIPSGVRADISGDLDFFRRMWRKPCSPESLE